MSSSKLILSGFTYGSMGILSLSSALMNSLSVYMYGATYINQLLILGDISSITLSIVIRYFLPIKYEPVVVIIRSILVAIQIGILSYYPTVRCGKMLGKHMKRISKLSPFALFIAVFLREVENDDLFKSLVPLIIFCVVAPLAYGSAIYALFNLGRVIRNNPAGKFDNRQVRLSKMSNFLVLTAGVIQMMAITASLIPAISQLLKTLMSMTALIFSTSDYLMATNKNLPDQMRSIHVSKMKLNE